MALKMDRQVDAVELSYFCNEVVERGNVLSVLTGGSGISMENPKSVATAAASSANARPIGILLNDVVDVDVTRVPLNWFKDQQRVGDKVTLLTHGWVVTNRIVGSPQAGQRAVLASSGAIAPVAVGTADAATAPIVGRFRSGLSEEGFAKVYIEL